MKKVCGRSEGSIGARPRESPRSMLRSLRLGELGRGVLRPYVFCGERVGSGGVESKSRDLGNDRGYRVAATRW
jgi:hypothetical protein